jgi:hypothetical protein
MASHHFNISGGAKYPKENGGISNDIPENLTTDLLRDFSAGDAVDCDTNTLTTAPGNSTSRNDVDVIFNVVGTYASIRLQDDSYSSGEYEQDLAIARAASGSTSFAGKTGYTSTAQYNRSLSTYTYGVRELQVIDGEGYNDTMRDDVMWNGTNVHEGSGYGLASTWSPGDQVSGDSDGYTYTVGAYQEVYNNDTYYSVIQSLPALLGYQNNTGVTITHMKVVWSGTTADQGGQTVPLRTLNGSAVGTSGDTGWVSVSGSTNIYFSVVQQISYTGGSTGTGSHNTDGKLEFWVRASGYNDTKIKEIGINIRTLAETT